MNIVIGAGLLATGFVSGAVGILLLYGRLLQGEFEEAEEAGAWRHGADFV